MMYLSEMDGRAAVLAQARGFGLETIAFCMPERMGDDGFIARKRDALRSFASASMHAPYAELFPCAVDPEMRELARKRLRQAGDICARLGVRRMIAHTGCAPRLYYPEWYVPHSIEFWRDLLRELPEDIELLLENVLDPEPAGLKAILDGVNDPRLGACLDVGHANVYAPVSPEIWIEVLGERIREVHLHNNDGRNDSHAALDDGTIDMRNLLAALRRHAPNADICLECRDVSASLAFWDELNAPVPVDPAAEENPCEVPADFDPARIVIPLLDRDAMSAAEARQRELAKPPGSLGVLEEISIRFAGMTGRLHNRARRRRLLVFAADNGVTEEGVSSAPKSVTLQQTRNLARGLTGAATLARHLQTELRVFDVGVDVEGPLGGGVVHRRIARGTRNIACGYAMTRGEAIEAIGIGFKAAVEAADDGIEILGVGEMGIGNTTTSAAVLSAILGLTAVETVGRGGGVNDSGLARKREIVDAAAAAADPGDVLDVLARAGGLDIAAMCGAFLGAASRRLPVVIDGYISAVAALCAERLTPGCRNYFFASHASWERGYACAMEALGLKPMLALEMRLGEGSGCPLAFEVIEAALVLLNEMATFEEARIDDGYLAEIRSDTRLQR